MILVDTNVLSELARRTPDPRVALWARGVTLPIAISVVTLDEIRFGLSWRPNPRIEAWFDDFLPANCEALPVTDDIAVRAGRLRGRLRADGCQRTQADMLIAATAQAHHLALVTRNVRDFDGCGIALLDPFQSTPRQ